MHEQSETIQDKLGRWINVYGKATPQAGQQLPGTPTYKTVDEAVTAAKARSEAEGRKPDAYTEAIRRLKTQYPQYANIPDDELATKVSTKYPQYKEMLTKPMPVESKGILGAAKDFITAGTRFSTGPSPLADKIASLSKSIPAAPTGLAMPPGASILGRTALQGGGAIVDALKGGKTSPTELATEGAKGAGFNLAAEAVLGPLGKFVSMARGAKTATAAHETAKTARGTQIATDEAAHAAASSAHAEKGAASIADDLFKQVPALQGTEVSGKGLYDAIYGTGKGKVSAAFDEALKAVAEKGAGQSVNLPAEIAERLGVKAAADPLAGVSGSVIEALRKAGRLPPGAGGSPGLTGIDASELAKKMTGLWKKDPEAYRAAARALDEAGIGDPAARSAYKAYTGTSDFLDKAKGLDANGVLNPDNILKAMADLKKVDVLRRRGLGSGTEGAIQGAARGGPLKPAVPPEPIAPNITEHTIPSWSKHLPGGAIGGAVGGPIGYGIGGLLSHLLLPSKIVTQGPLSPAVTQGVRGATGVLGVGARELLAPRQEDAE